MAQKNEKMEKELQRGIVRTREQPHSHTHNEASTNIPIARKDRRKYRRMVRPREQTATREGENRDVECDSHITKAGQQG